MLFDLRGRGRRRTIQVIYLFLALLMGGGLILFGIGGGTSGGLFDAFKSGNGSSGGSGFEKQIKAATRRTRLQPRNPAAWAELASVRYHAAGTGGNFDQVNNRFTNKGRAELARVRAAWLRYLALNPKKPDANVAGEMVRALGPDGLASIPDAVRAEEIVIDSQPANANLYAQLAVLAYEAGQTRKGDLAAAKAVSLTPKDQRASFKQQLDDAKTQAQGTAGASAGTTTTG